MPQPKKPAGASPRSKSTAKSGAKKPASRTKKAAGTGSGAAAKARKPAAKGSGTAKKPAARRSSGTAKTAAASPPATSSATAGSAEAREDALKANLAQLRELLAGGIVLTPQRLQETLDEAVSRGRMVRQDAEELTRSLLTVGRQQTQDLLSDIEGLIGRARTTASDTGDDLLKQVDKARRRVGAPPTFPILGYDDLAAGQVTKRLKDLTPSELRKVRDYERRNANRVSVLRAVEKELA